MITFLLYLILQLNISGGDVNSTKSNPSSDGTPAPLIQSPETTGGWDDGY